MPARAPATVALALLLLVPVAFAAHPDDYPGPKAGRTLTPTPVARVVEIEDFEDLAWGRLVKDPEASGGEAWELPSYGSVSTTVTIDEPGILWVTFRARGTHPEGTKNPHLHLDVDGYQRGEANVEGTWADHRRPYAYLAGTYKFEVVNFNNYYSDPRSAEPRTLYVDKMSIHASTLDGAPHVDLSAPLRYEAEDVHEAETGIVQKDAEASGGEIWFLWGTGCLATAVVVEESGTYDFSAKVRGNAPGGIPTKVEFRVDMEEVVSWGGYEPWDVHTRRVDLREGVHVLSVCYENDEGGDRKRNMWMDYWEIAPVAALSGDPPEVPRGEWLLPHATLDNHRSADSFLDADAAERLEVAWSYATAGAVTGTPVHDGETVYVADWGGKLHALDLDDGSVRWTANVPGGVDSTPALDAERLYVGDRDGNLTAFDRASGKVVWRVPADDVAGVHLYGSPVLHDGVLYTGVASEQTQQAYPVQTFRGSVIALDADDGTLLWRTRMPEEGSLGVSVWSTPAIDPDLGLLFVGTGNAYAAPAGDRSDAIVALRMDDGGVVWSHQATKGDTYNGIGNPGPDRDFGASPLLVEAGGRKLVVDGDKGGRMFALDRATGELAWRMEADFVAPGTAWEANEGFLGTFSYADGTIFAGTTSRSLVHAVDAATGDARWSREVNPTPVGYQSRMFGPSTHTNGLVLQGSAFGHFLVLDAASGEIVANVSTDQDVVGGISVAGDTLLVPLAGEKMYAGKGGLLAYRPEGGVTLPPPDDPPQDDPPANDTPPGNDDGPPVTPGLTGTPGPFFLLVAAGLGAAAILRRRAQGS